MHIFFKKHLSTLLFLIYSIFMLPFSAAQEGLNDDFNARVNSLLVEKFTSYSELDQALRKDKNDTLKMRFLARKCQEEAYLEGESFALTMIGIFYRNKSFFKKSTATHYQALRIAIDAENKELQVVNLNMLGVINRRIDNVRKALDYHQQALSLAESETEITSSLKKSIAVSLNSMGNIYLTLNQPDLALERFKRSLILEEENNNKLGLAINYQNIGYALEQKGKLDEALSNYNISLRYNEQLNSEVGKVICNNSIGQIYLKQNNPKKALRIIEPTLKSALKIGDQFYIASAYIGLGWAQLELNMDKLAEKNLTEGLKVAKQYNLKTSVSDALLQLSRLNKKRGNYKLALEQYFSSDSISHEIRNERNMKYVNALTFEYETESKNSQIKALASENELNKLKLKESNRNWLIVLLIVIFLSGIPLIVNRQKRLRNEKKILTLEQDMLRSQMNPHFIFNSLNSIKLYIINNEKENAVYYLNKFSKLIRKILIASKEKEISLAEELDTMALYLNIENIRFSNEIHYETHIDEDIDLEGIKVPSLILQPFLENALWHGLSTKKDNKAIIIDISKKNDGFVSISITDNGIGRKEAEKIKNKKLLKRKSLGIALTTERLSNFFKGYNKEYSIEIEDLYDKENKPSGTRVILNIPIQKTIKLKTA